MVVGWMGEGHEPEVLSKKGLSHPQEVVMVGPEAMRLDAEGDKVPPSQGCKLFPVCKAGLKLSME
jgi:hypothetical protein